MSMASTVRPVRIQSSAHSQDSNNQQPLPNPICWHEGMLLSPQHFQQNHQYWESQLRRVVSVLSADFWGVGELQLDRAALLEGVVSIQRLVAMMPDGLLIDYDARVDEPLNLELESEDDASTIQLVVPIQVPGSASERAEIQRYSSREDQPRIDENTGDNELVMPRLYPRVSLQAADRVGNRYVGLPLLRVVKPDGGSYQLDDSYIPPLLSIGADAFRTGDDEDMPGSRPLQHRCQALALAVRHKARQLAGLSDEGESLGSHITQRHHRWIRAMVQELVAFEQLADSSQTTPAALYQGLVRMAGPMSELDPNNIPPRFAAYCHDDVQPGLQALMDYIRQQVDRVNLSYTSLAFDEERDGVFTLNYDKAWEGKDLLVELRPASGGNRESVVNWLKSCRIASANVHKALQQRRMLGAKAEQIDSDENTGIVPASGNALFRIKANKHFIRTATKLAIMSTSKKLSEERPASILVHMPHD